MLPRRSQRPRSPSSTAPPVPHRCRRERSIRESHPKGVQLQAALGTFWQEVAVIERALAPLLPALVAGPPAGSAPAVAWF